MYGCTCTGVPFCMHAWVCHCLCMYGYAVVRACKGTPLFKHAKAWRLDNSVRSKALLYFAAPLLLCVSTKMVVYVSRCNDIYLGVALSFCTHNTVILRHGYMSPTHTCGLGCHTFGLGCLTGELYCLAFGLGYHPRPHNGSNRCGGAQLWVRVLRSMALLVFVVVGKVVGNKGGLCMSWCYPGQKQIGSGTWE